MSSWYDANTASVSQCAHSVLAANKEAAVRLPHPDETYRYADAPAEVQRVFRRFREDRIIRHVDTRDETMIYRSDRRAYHVGQRYTDRDTLPCGHGGFKNLGETYTCSEASCDSEHTREDVAEYLARREP